MKYGVMKYGVMKYEVMKNDVMKYDVMKYDVMKTIPMGEADYGLSFPSKEISLQRPYVLVCIIFL